MSGFVLLIATRASSLVTLCSGTIFDNGILLSNKAFLRYARHQFLVGNFSEYISQPSIKAVATTEATSKAASSAGKPPAG